MITDIEARRFVEIVPDRKKVTIARYLEQSYETDLIGVTVVDMPILEEAEE